MEILGFAVGVGSIDQYENITGQTTTLSQYTSEGFYLDNIDNDMSVMLDKPNTSCWVSFNYRVSRFDTTYSAGIAFELRSSDGTVYLDVYYAASKIYCRARKTDGSMENISTYSVSTTSTLRYDIEYTADRVSFYVNGILRAQTTDNTTYVLTPSLPISELYFRSAPDSGDKAYLAGVFAATESTLGVHMVQHTVEGKGAYHNDFQGDYSKLIETGSYGTANAMYATESEAKQTFSKTGVPVALQTDYDIVGVGVYTRSKRDNSETINSVAALITDGTNSLEEASDTLNLEVSAHTAIFNTAPDGTAWDVAKFEACEVGLVAKA